MSKKEDKSKKIRSNQTNIRDVHFGLRIRFLALLSLVMILIITTLVSIMYLNQRNLLEEEKNRKAASLTQILSGPAEFYLDKNINTPEKELSIKYEIISKEASNFKSYNSDIVKIFLTDDRGKIKFSTNKRDLKRRKVYSYIKKTLNQDKEELLIYDYSIKIKPKKKSKNKRDSKDKKSEEYKKIRYRAITYPIFLQKGNVIDLLNDFKKFYQQYHDSDKKRRDQIYQYLWSKYRDTLGEDFNPTNSNPNRGLTDKIVKANDIDFLFAKLFGNIMIIRDKRIKKNERWLWRDKWLFIQKRKKLKAYSNDMPAKAKEINDLIISRLNKLSDIVENVRRLGALAIIFDVDKIQNELDKNINQVIIFAVIMILISGMAFLLILNYMIQNLKRLESWAMAVSAGNLESKIEIKTKDEIGRLGDIFNYMFDEIKSKYHLEKFVSKSTRSMIDRKKSTSDDLDLGRTSRKNLAFIFSDVRGFTSFSEQNDPETVMEVLNFYLDLQAKIIKSQKGDIDDYTGDEIMAHFGGEKKADTVIETAVKIIKEISRVNADRKKKKLPTFEVGIGIHGGNVVVGNIGSEFRMDFTCIGDVVNLSARLCSAAKPGEILVSQELFSQAKKKFKHEKIKPISVKGKSEKIQIVRITI